MTKRKSERRRVRRSFTPEFRQEAVRLMQERRAAGITLEQIARELDVGPDLLRTWAQQQQAGATDGRPTGPESPAEELARLRRENAVLRQERDFLKKAAAFFAKESR